MVETSAKCVSGCHNRALQHTPAGTFCCGQGIAYDDFAGPAAVHCTLHSHVHSLTCAVLFHKQYSAVPLFFYNCVCLSLCANHRTGLLQQSLCEGDDRAVSQPTNSECFIIPRSESVSQQGRGGITHSVSVTKILFKHSALIVCHHSTLEHRRVGRLGSYKYYLKPVTTSAANNHTMTSECMSPSQNITVPYCNATRQYNSCTSVVPHHMHCPSPNPAHYTLQKLH